VGHAVAQLVGVLRYKHEGRGFDSRWYHWNFSLTQSFQPNYGVGFDSASTRNEYQEYFPGGKGGRCVGLPNVLISGSLKFLESSGPVQGLLYPKLCKLCSCRTLNFRCCLFSVFEHQSTALNMKSS
jgi:hypothetical protein